jgi:predicted nucleotidyltransferase
MEAVGPSGRGDRKLTDKTKEMLSEVKSQLACLYGARFKGLFVFGSYARDEANEESDVDLLIVLDDVEDYSLEISATSELISEIALKYDLSLSRVFASEQDWRDNHTLFFKNVREEAIPA